MHIILVSNRLAKARTVTLTPRLVLALGAGFVALVLLLSSLFSYLTVRHAAEIRLPFLQELVRAITIEESQRNRDHVRENLKAMAIKLGEMQAQLSRLDSLGERLSSLAGLKPQEVKSENAPRDGRGGPLINPAPMEAHELQAAVDALAQKLEARTDTLSMIEAQLFEERVRRNLLPTTLPVEVQWNASTFGWRIDPFTGERAMHEGVDFPAAVGTPIVAAAAGVVVSAEYHPEYGYLVEIDHGNDLSTRYAHTSKMFVQPGAVVKRGQLIAAVGNTGRSTGPHLHFEVRYRGSAQNPNRFLQQAMANSTRLAGR